MNMRNLITGFAASLLFAATASAQEVKPDSLTAFLCKKWEINYAIMGGMKIERLPTAAQVNYEFLTDKTFTITGNDGTQKVKGSWTYLPDKKMIKLVSNGKNNTNIVSLKSGEFVLIANTRSATPDDPMPMKMVFKVKGN